MMPLTFVSRYELESWIQTCPSADIVTISNLFVEYLQHPNRRDSAEVQEIASVYFVHANGTLTTYEEPRWYRFFVEKIKDELHAERASYYEIQQAVIAIALKEHELKTILLKISDRDAFLHVCEERAAEPLPENNDLYLMDRWESGFRKGDWEPLLSLLAQILATEEYGRSCAEVKRYNGHLTASDGLIYAESPVPAYIDGLASQVVRFYRGDGDIKDTVLNIETYGQLAQLFKEYS